MHCAVVGSMLLFGQPAEVEAAEDEAIEAVREELESQADLEDDRARTVTSESAAAVSAADEAPELAVEAAEEGCKCEEDAAPPADEPKPPVSGLLIGGGVLTAGGFGSAIAGAALLGARRDNVAPEGAEPNVADYRLAGAIAAGVGVAALATGVVLLMVHRRKNKTKGKAMAVVVPGPGAGLGVYARF